MRKVFSPLAFAVIASIPVAATESAHAQELRWHLGASIAQEYDRRGPHRSDADAENARGLLLGVTHSNGFGVELAYVDLGELRSPGILGGGFAVDGTLWSLGATYARRMDAIEPYAKLGWFRRDEDGISISIPGVSPLRLDDDGLMAEVGVRWYVTEPFALRVGYVHYDFDDGSDGSAQLAAEWHF